jgi:peptidoglycan/LPS O-acetylase OafA/YrhL
MRIDYRKDITGLRAIAVLAVLIFHISPQYLQGGYLGVDIFFVISGYLISSILINEYNTTNTISLSLFYKKRILRILPATLFIIFITALISKIIMIEDSFRYFLKSALFSSIGFANIFFYKTLDTSYFATDSALNPLLHLWSLGVEEQFYFVLPLIFLLFFRFKKAFLFIIILLFMLSISLAQFMYKKDYMFTYYLPLTRSFALFLGVIVSLFVHHNIFKFNNRILLGFLSFL